MTEHFLLVGECHFSTTRNFMQRSGHVRYRAKIAHLEDIIEKMQLDAHASRVAIAVLSTSLNGLMGKDAKLGDMYLNSIAQADSGEIDNKVSDGYIAKLNEKVAALLGTQQ